MNLLKCILTNNACYKSGKTIAPKGVMVHSTAAPNTTLKRYVQPMSADVPNAYEPDRAALLKLLGTNKYGNDWNHDMSGQQACVHAFVGTLADGSIATVQTLPWNMKGWHAGTGTTGKSANNTHISFEICEDDHTSKSYFEKAKNEAVEFVAYLCKLYNFDPMADGVIICHQDGYKRGIACNHSDIYNWWPKFDYNMDNFRTEVASSMKDPEPDPEEDDDMIYYEKKEEIPVYYQETIFPLIESGVIKGVGGGNLHLSDDLCRTLVILDRMGKL